MKLLGVFGRIVTNAAQFQLDPPEVQLLANLGAQLIFSQENVIIKSRLYDGVIHSIIDDVLNKLANKELKIEFVKELNLESIFKSEGLEETNSELMIFNFKH